MKKKILKVKLVLTFLMITVTGFTQCIQQMSIGDQHILVLDDEGYLWTGGSNRSGQLGDGTTVNRNELQKTGNKTWKTVAAGLDNSLAIQSDGTLWAWGNNDVGQIGAERIGRFRSNPTQISTDTDWKAVSVGVTHGLALKENGSLWGWGFGFLGLKDQTLIPQQIGTETNWKSILAGFRNSWAIKSDGSLWAWGNDYPEGAKVVGNTPYKMANIKQIGMKYDWEKMCSNSGSLFYFFAIAKDGTLWGSGENYIGIVLNADSTNWGMQPIQMDDATDWKEISISRSHILALKDDGSLWAAGKNGNGQLGNNSFKGSGQFVSVGSDRKWKAIGAGVDFSVAISEDNQLFTWGSNHSGQLINGMDGDKAVPSQVGTKRCHKLSSNDFNTEKVKVYPNPTSRDITVDFGNALFEEVTVTIYNSIGQIVSQKTTQKQTEILPIEGVSGFYSVKIDFPDGETSSHKILKK